MNRVKSLATAIGFAAVLGMAPAAIAGVTHEHTHIPGPDVEIAATKLSGNVSVVMGVTGFAGGNVGVSAGADGILIVDDMLPGFQHKLENVLALTKTCVDCGELKYLINTHWHFDHAGNNEHFGAEAVLIAHDTVRPKFMEDHEFKALNLHIPAKSQAGLPDIAISQKASIFFNGEEIELKHFPNSHTDGDITVYFKSSNVVHLGDLYFNGMFPFIDLENGGNVKGMIKSVEQALKAYPDDVQIIPGHGAMSDMKGLRAFLDMLKSTTAIVEKAKAQGKSLEDVQKAGLGKTWDSWSWEFVNTETWIALVYNSL